MLTRAEAEQRVAEARRAHHAAMDLREKNRTPDTAVAVAIARQHFEDAQRALARRAED